MDEIKLPAIVNVPDFLAIGLMVLLFFLMLKGIEIGLTSYFDKRESSK